MPRTFITPLRLFTSIFLFIITIFTLLHIHRRPPPIPESSEVSIYHTFTPPPPVNFSYAIPQPPSGPNAVVFYATASLISCSSLLNIARLRVLSPNIPVIALLTPDVPQSLQRRYVSLGVHILNIPEASIPRPNTLLGRNDYYALSLVKLLALGLDQPSGLPLPPTWPRKRRLERVVILDADTLILSDLYPLFTSSVLNTNSIAAPPVYWENSTAVTSALMVARLSSELWKKTQNSISNPQKGEYDMDLVNRVLQPAHLTPEWLTLNSDFQEGRIPSWASSPDDDTSPREFWNSQQIKVLHFSDGGKPWDIILPKEVPPVFSTRERMEQLVWGAWGSEERERRRRIEEGKAVWEEGVRIWQDGAREICGWEQHIVEV